jgi:biopolymer transport protein ExbD
MARHQRPDPPEDDEPELNISSMIDICFLLLIYFLVTTTIKKKERDVDMALPSAAPSDAQPDIQPMFIKIDVNGTIYLNHGPAQEILDSDAGSNELPQLQQRLETYASAARTADSQPLVQIYVEGDAKQQRVVDVLNALGKEGIEKVTFTDLIDTE